MKLNSMGFLATVLLGVALTAAVAEAQITLVSQERSVYANACGGVSQQSAPDFGPIDFSVYESCSNPFRAASATQTSTLSTSQITSSQSVSAREAISSNAFVVVFDVTEPVRFSFTTSRNGDNPPPALTLTGPAGSGGDVFPPVVRGTRSESGILAPGRYTLSSPLSGNQNSNLTLGFTVVTLPSFSIDWSTIDCGGGTVAAGRWELSGTIGQPDAALPVSADEWTLSGGFWGVKSITYPCRWYRDNCFGDYNDDGGIDSDDVIGFFNAWDAAEPCADVDRSRGIDSDDVIEFFGLWDSGGTGTPGC
ncbi:MAG: hypothetical protein ACOYN0_15430 [Phycisphaerales bacterium]